MSYDRGLTLRRYAVALPTVGAAAWLAPILPPDGGVGTTALFFAAVMVTSWFGGLGPGLLASAIATVAVDYVVIPPAFSWVFGWNASVHLAVFALVATMTSFLNGARRYFEAEERGRTERIAQRWLEEKRRRGEATKVLANELTRSTSSLAHAIEAIPIGPDAGPDTVSARSVVDGCLRQLTEIVDALRLANNIDSSTSDAAQNGSAPEDAPAPPGARKPSEPESA